MDTVFFYEPYSFYPAFLLVGHTTIPKSQIAWALQVINPFEQPFRISGGIFALIMPKWMPFFLRDGRWACNLSVFIRKESLAGKWQFFQGVIQTMYMTIPLNDLAEYSALALCAILSNSAQKICRKSGLGTFQLLMAWIALTTFCSNIAV